MTQAAGWYDDPQDPSKLRYWDGVVWSTHVSPKISPSVEQSTIGMPYGVLPASARPHTPGSQGAQGAPTTQDGFGSPHQGQEQPGGQWPAYPQAPGVYGQEVGWQSHPVTTPDGAQLSGWWLRVAARLLDQLITFFIALPFTGWFYVQYFVNYMNWANDLANQSIRGSAPVFAFPTDVFQYLLAIVIIQYLISGIYEVFFLTRSGATPGKKVVGISVRLRDQAGPPPMKTAVIRTACMFGMQVLSPAYLIDDLWPLWDDKKQAIHDKPAHTNVVVGPQHKRDA